VWNRRPRRFLERAGEGACSTYILVPKLPLGSPDARQALLGSEVKGEGVMGLTRAFMYAGTPSVAVTLWSVESQSAKLLNVSMHGYLLQGKGRAEALREIKLALLRGEKGEKYRHPFYWAPFVVFGDGR